MQRSYTENIAAIPLAAEEPDVGSPTRAVGWGTRSDDEESISDVLYEGKNNIFATRQYTWAMLIE